MFNLFFSFRGRIGRLRYFLTGIGSGLLITVAFVAGASSIAWKQSPQGGMVAMAALLLVLAFCGLWSGFSLQVRRIRDIGWDPVVVIVGFIGASIVVRLGAGGAGHSAHLAAAPLSLGYSLVLLFWPGEDAPAAPDLDAVFGGEPDWPQPVRAAPPRPASAAAGTHASAPTAAPAPRRPGRPAKTFGRRGLA